MAGEELSFETHHEDLIHDAQLDYYGSRLATASSDRAIKIFNISGEQQVLLAELKGHDGPVWSVAWSHPKFDGLLASCSYDCRTIIWKEGQNGWERIFTSESAQSSVNCVAWAPPEFGPMLLACSSDNYVSVYSYDRQQWKESRFQAHLGGVNAGSWCPGFNSNAILSQEEANAPVSKRIVTAGNDHHIRIWRLDETSELWVEDNCFDKNQADAHTDWVRDVAWAPSLGLPTNIIASCSEDKSCLIWTQTENGMWTVVKKLSFEHKVWRVSWSVMGNLLAISQGDNKVSIWKESLSGEWEQISSVDDQNTEK